jgi:hypothetical protein
LRGGNAAANLLSLVEDCRNRSWVATTVSHCNHERGFRVGDVRYQEASHPPKAQWPLREISSFVSLMRKSNELADCLQHLLALSQAFKEGLAVDRLSAPTFDVVITAI